MATLTTRVTDSQTGNPLAGASVSLVLLPGSLPSTPTLPGGFTGRNGEYPVALPTPSLFSFAIWDYTITVTAPGYTTNSTVRRVVGRVDQFHVVALDAIPVTLTTPLTYPAVVGVGQAPDLSVSLPTGSFDELVVNVTGAFPSRSRSPIPAVGPVLVPLASRLLVAPPAALTPIGHAERFRAAGELAQPYTITVAVRQGDRLWPLGLVTTTALLADLADLPVRLPLSPWLSPWPGPVPLERGGYTEVVLALPTPTQSAQLYNLFITAHEGGIDGSVAYQDTRILSVAPSPVSYQPFRVRLPDYTTPAVRLLVASSLGNLSAIWGVYRTF